MSKNHIKFVYVNNGTSEKRIPLQDLDSYTSNGWVRGHSDLVKKKIAESLIGNIPWNKGLNADTDSRVKMGCDKSTKTKIEKYGSAFPNNNMDESHKKKISETNKGKRKESLIGKKRPKEVCEKISKAKIGHTVSQETREKLRNAIIGKKFDEKTLLIKLSKEYITKKKNNSFTKSKPEQDLYETLLRENTNKTIYRQYKDPNRYPFYCDFYIKEDDLFIELNAHWTHGGRPFDPNDESCQEKLKGWQEKAKTSKFYQTAIDVWTVRDVEKLRFANENHLNYKVIY